MKTKLLAYLLITAMFSLLAVQSWANTHTSVTSGNWNDASTWSPSGIPGSGDDVIITAGHTITVTANAAILTVTFNNSSSSTSHLIVNTGVTLAITGDITIENAAGTSRYAHLEGGGTINCEDVVVGGTVTFLSSDQVTILTSSIANLVIGHELRIYGEDYGTDDNDASFYLNTGSVSVASAVNCDEESGSSCSLRMDQGADQNGTLILLGSNPFINSAGSLSFFANGTNATVNYSTASQTIEDVTYKHLSTSVGGTKTISSSFTVNGNLTIGTGTTLTLYDGAGIALTVVGNIAVNGTGIFNVTNSFYYSYVHNLNLSGNLHVEGTFTMTSSGGDDVCNVNLNGSALQTIDGSSTPNFNSLTLNNTAGCDLSGINAIVHGTFALSNGRFNTGTTDTLIIHNSSTTSITGYSSARYVNGNLRRQISSGSNTYLFPIGTSTVYAPVSISFTSGTASGFLTGSTTNGDHPDIGTSDIGGSSSVNRFWKFEVYSGLGTANYNATFNWVAGDQDLLFDYTEAFCGKYNGSSWTYPVMGTLTPTSAQITGVTSFSIFQIGSENVPEGEIEVYGNSTRIADGDNTPSLDDHTSFGDITPSATLIRTYTIKNSGGLDLTVSGIALTGTHSSLFTVGGITFPAIIAGDNTTTFTITFTPTSAGLKNATVTISHDDIDEGPFDFVIQGERNCYAHSLTVAPTAGMPYTGGVNTNLYIGYGPQKDTLKTTGFGGNITWSPGTYLSCASGCAKTVFTATVPGSFTYTASNGCISNEVTIVVKDVRHSGTGTSAAKVYLCHKEPVYNTIQTLVVLVRGVPSHFQYHPGDYLSSCVILKKKTDEYSELVISEGELEVICTPNPFRKSFKLNYNGISEEDATILVYGMTGNLLEKITLNGLSNEVELGDNLPTGIFTVTFVQGDKKRTFRMIKVE